MGIFSIVLTALLFSKLVVNINSPLMINRNATSIEVPFVFQYEDLRNPSILLLLRCFFVIHLCNKEKDTLNGRSWCLSLQWETCAAGDRWGLPLDLSLSNMRIYFLQNCNRGLNVTDRHCWCPCWKPPYSSRAHLWLLAVEQGQHCNKHSTSAVQGRIWLFSGEWNTAGVFK